MMAILQIVSLPPFMCHFFSFLKAIMMYVLSKEGSLCHPYKDVTQANWYILSLALN